MELQASRTLHWRQVCEEGSRVGLLARFFWRQVPIGNEGAPDGTDKVAKRFGRCGGARCPEGAETAELFTSGYRESDEAGVVNSPKSSGAAKVVFMGGLVKAANSGAAGGL